MQEEFNIGEAPIDIEGGSMTGGYAVEARLTPRRSDGSVAGSYDASTMENLLHYRQEDALFVGAMAVGGEVMQG